MAAVQSAIASLSPVEAISAFALVNTTTAAFLGESSRGPILEPVLVDSVRSYRELFGDARDGRWLADAVAGYFANGGTRAVICNIGGVVSSIDRPSRFAAALQRLDEFPEVALVCAPGQTESGVQELILSHCEASRLRFAVLDGPEEVELGAVTTLPRPRDSAFGAYYFPWVYVNEAGWGTRAVPPSGHIAGLLARWELERGVTRRRRTRSCGAPSASATSSLGLIRSS